MPTRHRTFAREEKLPSYWINAIQDILVGLASNFVVTRLNATTIRVPAGAGKDRAVCVVDGLFRWREANTDRAVAGTAGTYAVFAVAKANAVTNIPVSDTDATDYNFDLRVVLDGTTPAIAAGTVDVFQKVATFPWDGAAISGPITQLLPASPRHATTHATAGGDAIAPADIGAATTVSPTFTGAPAGPTASADTNTSQLATTAYVIGQAGNTAPVINGVASAGASLRYSRQDHVHPTDTSRAPTASPTLTGTVTLPSLVSTTTTLGFFGTTPAARSGARTLTNWTAGANALRALNRDTVTVQQLFDAVATMIYDLQQHGLYA